jgi:uncharacterized membrane protein
VAQAEAEEVVTIGAVDVAPRENVGAVPQDATDESSASDATRQADAQAQASADEVSTQAQADEDLDFGAPMPLMQKLVIAICGIALVVTLVFLVRFWVFT